MANNKNTDSASTSMTKMNQENSSDIGMKKVKRWLPLLAITYFMMVGATVTAAALLFFDFFGPDRNRQEIVQTDTTGQQSGNQTTANGGGGGSSVIQPIDSKSDSASDSASDSTNTVSGDSTTNETTVAGTNDNSNTVSTLSSQGAGESAQGDSGGSSGTGSTDSTVVAMAPTPPTPKPMAGTIEIINELTPEGDSGVFDLMVNGRVVLSDATGRGRSGPIDVSAGSDLDPGRTHIVGEAAGRGTDIGFYDSGIECVDNAGVQVTSCTGCTSLDVDVKPDDRLVCTVSNLLAYAPPPEQTDPTSVAKSDVPTGAGSEAQTTGTLAPGAATLPPEISVANLSRPQSIQEPGGAVTYTVKIRNHSESNADLTVLESDTAGSLDGKGNCLLPQTIPANGGVYTCSYVVDVAGGPGDVITNVVTAKGANERGTDQSTNDSEVNVIDLPSSIAVIKRSSVAAVAEPGSDVIFDVEVNNTSAIDTVVVTGIEDSVHGNIDGKGNCRFPSTIVAGEKFECTFSAYVTGNAGAKEVGKISVVGEDDDGNEVTGEDETLVTINDVKSEIEVVKSADSDTIPEPGGSVTYDVKINNISSVDTVTVETLIDSIEGDLNGVGTCEMPQEIESGGTYFCKYTVDITGNAGDVRSSELTADGIDDDGVQASATGESSIALQDLPSSISVTRTADKETLAEPGGEVLFGVQIMNTSAVDSIRVTDIEDTVFGNLDGVGDCKLPQSIGPGDAYSCELSGSVKGVPGDNKKFTTTIEATDDDGRILTGNSSNTVAITDVPSSIKFAATSEATSISEPGGVLGFNVVVQNESKFDQVTVTSLQDSILKDLSEIEGSDCELPQTIGVGKTYSCSFNSDISGNAGDVQARTITLSGEDDDGVPITGVKNLSIPIDDIASSVAITVVPSVEKIAEPGGDVSFAVEINNTSPVDTITANDMVDSTFGTLDGLGDCELPQTLAAGAIYRCSITGDVSGTPGQQRTNTVEVSATDDDGVQISSTAVSKIEFSDVVSSISVSKQSEQDSVPEPGGEVAYQITVENTSAVDAVTVVSLDDSVYGDLTKINGTSCELPYTIDVGKSYSCTATGRVSGNAGANYPSTLTVGAKDDDGVELSGIGSISIAIADVPSSIEAVTSADSETVAEPGGQVNFKYSVRNTSSVDSVSISTLSDSIIGDLTAIEGSDCSVPQVIEPGDSYSCSAQAEITGNAQETRPNTFTAKAEDDDGAAVSSTSTVSIGVVDVPSRIEVTTKSSNREIDEPGETVDYSYVVLNQSPVDAVTITSLDDSVFQSLDGIGTCGLPQTLAPGDRYSCSIEKDIAGLPGEQFTNIVTAAGLDDDGQTVSSEGSETVTIIDVASAILVDKSSSSDSVSEPGGNITFGFAILNESPADEVVIDNVNDSVYGDVTAVPGSSCEFPQTIAAGQQYSCEITAMVRGAAGYVENSVATATGRDDDGNRVAHSDGAIVSIEDVDSGIEVQVIPDKPEVTEPGGVVLYTFEMSNVSPVDPITVTEITDSVYGDLTAVPGTTCLMPLTIAPGGRYGCAIQGQVSGDVGAVLSNEVVVKGRDNDGKVLSTSHVGRVEIVGVATGIRVDQQVDKVEIDAPGDDVTFTFNLVNRSPKHTANVDTLSDSIFGDLNGLGDCRFPQAIEPSGSFSCSVAIEITGRAGETRTNTVKATGRDDDGNDIVATDVEKIVIRSN